VGPDRGVVAPGPGDEGPARCAEDARESRSDEEDSTRLSGPAVRPGPAADGLPVAVDPSTASFRALARQVRAIGLLDRRPGYYRVKITLTIFAFLAGWALFVIVGNSWAALAVAPLVGMTVTQLGFIGHDAGHNQVFGTRRRSRLLGLIVGNALIGLSFGWWVPKHNAHHAHPNEMGRDPDIGEGVALASPDAPGTSAALSHRGWHVSRRRSSSPYAAAKVCTYSGSSGFCGDETTPRRSKPLSSCCMPRCT
jgi:Fatty acid desaturase